VSEANPDRERRSQDHAAPTQDPSAAPAGLTGGTDPESAAVRPRPRTKPRTGARPPRPAGTHKTPTQVPAAPDAQGAAPSTPVGDEGRVTSRSAFSAGLDHLPKATPSAPSASPFAAPEPGAYDPTPTVRRTTPVPDATADEAPQPSVLERARAGVVAVAAVAMEKAAQVSSAATTTIPAPVTPDPATVSRAVQRPRRTRRARLRISRIDPWSVMKTSLLFGIAGGIIFVVATYVLMSVIQATGLFDAVNQMVKDILASPTDTTTFDITTYINTKRATGLAALIGAIDVVIFTALATVFSFLYNLSATMLGGLEITLAED
jgi:hypothetical protein